MKSSPLLLALTALASPVFALNTGDTVPPEVLKQLGAEPDKVLVVDFFAEWCESCRKELPLISALSTRSNPAQVTFVGIDTDEDTQVGQAFQAELKAQGALSFRVIDDPRQALVDQFSPRGYPALYLIKGGKIVAEHLGATPDIDSKLSADLTRLGASTPSLASTAREQP